ncbi:hypothetical protein MMC14_003280 [Varicellaria rhodocarpa]|nr:hypothetical protein [Varicellaria rhodocarpa]
MLPTLSSFIPLPFFLFLFSILQSINAESFYDNPDQDPLPQVDISASADRKGKEELDKLWGFDYGFSGISTFAHLPHVKCLTAPDVPFDIGIIGAPFDTAVSYRPGARFGPRAIRAASARQSAARGFNPRRGLNPYISPLTILDCGDIPLNPFDNLLALKQMTSAFLELGSRSPALPPPPLASSFSNTNPATTNNPWPRPKLLTLGGDHSIALGALRALSQIHNNQPLAVLHFDAHLDTWHPATYPSAWGRTPSSDFTHGSMFHLASTEGLILNGSSAHAGLRTRLAGSDWADYTSNPIEREGFLRITADDIDDLGTRGIVDQILQRIGTEVPVYLSLDIDVLDPGVCPGTGTPEPGGWTSREVIRILRGLEGLNVVGADIVEVAPAYDGVGEQTALVAAQVGFEILTSWVGRWRGEVERLEKEGGGGVKDEL